ncbi:MAG: DEAD/DEAH box helicase [Bacteroidetes bacterium]|jgi:ATP-dependent RNA helicase DeaD|nr:DEAD/DEAH box helicase [Bacteroidota bacterium]
MNSNNFAFLKNTSSVSTFKDLGIAEKFTKGLTEMGIIEPTPIQLQVIPMLLHEVTDMVGQAQTGTGKTAAFGLPLLHRIDPKKKVVQGLVLCPTRELGQQVAKQLFKFTKYSDKVFTEAVYGGAKIEMQIKNLTRPTHIIVATPGRLIDLVNREAVDLSQVKTIIMDEADEMLSLGFKKELDQILSFVASAEERWLFSATMPHGIKEIVNNHLSSDAARISVSSKNQVNKNIEHQYIICEENEKLHLLMEMLRNVPNERGIIFCKTKVAAQKLTKQLIAKNVPADTINGDLRQLERDKVMRAFKNESLRILVATDLAARGIDVQGLTFVVHYQLPDQDEYYTHRSGRTARAGKRGISLCLVTSTELKVLKYYEKSLGIAFNQLK